MGTVVAAGPEQFRLDELVRQGLLERDDPREVVADPHARYLGVELSQRTLVPSDDARLGETRFGDWLSRSTPNVKLPVSDKSLVSGRGVLGLADDVL